MPDVGLLRLAYERGEEPLDQMLDRVDEELVTKRSVHPDINSLAAGIRLIAEQAVAPSYQNLTDSADPKASTASDPADNEHNDLVALLPPGITSITVSHIMREEAAREVEQNLNVATPITDPRQLERHRSRSFAVRAALDINYLLSQYDQCDQLVLAIADSPYDIVISSDDYDDDDDNNDSITTRFLNKDASLAQIMHFVKAVIGELPHENDENDAVVSAYRTLEIMTAPLRSSGAWSDDDTHHRPVRVSPEEHAREAIEHEKLLRKSRTNALIRYQRLFDGTMWPVLTSAAEEKTIAAAKERKIEQAKARVEKAEKNRFDELDTQRLALKVKRILAQINDVDVDARDSDDADDAEYEKQRRQDKAAERRKGRLENERQEYGLRSVRPRVWSADNDIVEWRPR